MSLEVERKYLNVDFAALLHILHAQGAHDAGAHFESNILFDTPDGALRASGRLLRLRTREYGPHAAGQPHGTGSGDLASAALPRSDAVLTLKLPSSEMAAHAASCADDGFKVREERELTVGDAPKMQSVLEGLGYQPAARYEKVRHVLALGQVEVLLDSLPFANVVELEGEPQAILQVEQRLGLDNAVISTKNYHKLHQEFRRAHNLPPELSFVFAAEERLKRRRLLGITA